MLQAKVAGHMSSPPDAPLEATLPLPLLSLRAALGGVLMGLANLVPGISGGTMLLAAGVYTGFIRAIAEVTTLRFRIPSLVLLGVIVTSAFLAILLLAGPTRTLVVEERWIMYSLFIGLTFGGVPLVWRMARPLSAGVVVGGVLGFAVMLAMALAPGSGGGDDGPQTFLLFVSGMAGAGAMILPGVSGGYLLLLLGQYLPILGAVDKLKQSLLGDAGFDSGLFGEALAVVIPVGIGVVIGVVAISNLLKLALDRFPKPTLGALLGLLFGAVVGLWPFAEGVAPEPGDTIKGRVVTAESAADIDPEDWPVERFAPSAAQAGSALGLILLGFGLTRLIDRVGGGAKDEIA
jgi:putative membrane protein